GRGPDPSRGGTRGAKLAGSPRDDRAARAGRRDAVEVVHPRRGRRARRGDRAGEDRRAVRDLQRRHRRLHHGARDRRAGGGVRRPGAGKRALRLHGRRSRLEGRRADRPAEHGPDQDAGLALRAPVARGPAPVAAGDDPGVAGGALVTAPRPDADVELLYPAADVADPEMSIVIPALNEELTIPDFVAWCHAGMKAAGVVGEILIVDSGSDRTTELALAGG